MQGGIRKGFTLLETMIAVTAVAGLLVGLLGVVVHLSWLNAIAREDAAALRGAEGMIETMRNTAFASIFATYNRDPSDDPPPGPGSAPGSSFDVPDLLPRREDADRKCGRILFPVDSSGLQLREDVDDPFLKMPLDLDGNGMIDTVSVAATYKILPVSIQIEWEGIRGPTQWTYRTIILKRR